METMDFWLALPNSGAFINASLRVRETAAVLAAHP
jgi:hypothetical protein